jgi:hypothetical protein
MAIGFLFLGGGTHTFSTRNSAVAALLVALYPRLPTGPNDNRCHLQVIIVYFSELTFTVYISSCCKLMFFVVLWVGIQTSICTGYRASMGSDSWCWHRTSSVLPIGSDSCWNRVLWWNQLYWGDTLSSARTLSGKRSRLYSDFLVTQYARWNIKLSRINIRSIIQFSPEHRQLSSTVYTMLSEFLGSS